MDSVGAALGQKARALAGLASGHPRLTAATVAILLGLIALWAVTRTAPAGPTGDAPSATTHASSGTGPQVPPVNACGLLADFDVEEALGLLVLPWEERELIEYGGGERCTWHHIRDGEDVAGLALFIGPGSPDDFAADASLDGAAGRSVTGIGTRAVWFGATDAGTLSVVQPGRLGYVFMRVVLEREDADDAQRLEAATRAAARALPHLPGMEGSLPAVEPEVITSGPVDLSGEGFAENLLAREAAGEWTREDGLVATLRHLLGEGDAADLPGGRALESTEGTGVMRMARDYLVFGTDAEAKTTILALLDRLVYTNQELEEMAGIGQPAANGGRNLLAAAVRRQQPAPVPAQAVENCAAFFDGYELPAGVSQCLEWRPAQDPAGQANERYRIFIPAPSLPQAGWTEKYYRDAVEALEQTILFLQQYGRMPPINVVFTVSVKAKAGGEAVDPGFGRTCSVALHPNLQRRPETFPQVVAHELVHCFTGENFPRQNRVTYPVIKWWVEGVADHFSNVVYPRLNREWESLPSLAQWEMLTTVLTRGYTNWTLFLSLANAHSDDTILALLGTLPGCGTADDAEMTETETAECSDIGDDDQAAALRKFGAMPDLFHSYMQGMTDASIVDTSGVPIPFAPQSTAVQAPSGAALAMLDAFGVARMHVVVPTAHYACMEYELVGDTTASWRRGLPGKDAIGGPWDEMLPDALEGEAVFAATSTLDGAEFLVRVRDLVEDASDCDPADDGASAGDACLTGLCGPSDYFRFREQLPEWLQEVLPLLDQAP